MTVLFKARAPVRITDCEFCYLVQIMDWYKKKTLVQFIDCYKKKTPSLIHRVE